MPNKELRLDCSLSSCDVTLGPGKKATNKIVVQLKNTADDDIQFQGRGSQGTLSLLYSVGNQATDLVGDDEQSRAVQIAPEAGWEAKDYANLSGQVTRPFRLPPVVLKGKAQTTLSITNFQCESDPGQLKLTVRVEVTGYDPFEKAFDIDKKTTEELQILYFRANPPQILTPQDCEKFVLEWNTLKATSVKLYKADQLVDTVKVGTRDFKNGTKFSYGDQKPSMTFHYRLVALDTTDPDNRQDKETTVQVIPRGWRKLDDFRDQLGYPAVLCNMDGVKLYGIFVKQGKARLCSSEYPVAVWNVESADVPANMATSPAVSFGKQLWLVGGSASDPRNFSNQVWSYSPKSGQWSRRADAMWTRRMGHACVVHENRLWVLGGFEPDGNALKEVWSCGVNDDWKQHAAPLWAARCMHAATVYDKKIWIYGGVTEPFADPLQDIWKSSNGDNWEEDESIRKQRTGKPLGCALKELNGELILFGTFREENITEARRFTFDAGQKSWNKSSIPEELAWYRQGVTTFHLLAAEYKGVGFLRSLNHETKDNPTALNMFVP
jgi:Galactose oxidase, central domain